MNDQNRSETAAPAVGSHLDRRVMPPDPKREAVRNLAAAYARLMADWQKMQPYTQEVANAHATFKHLGRTAALLFEEGAIGELLRDADRYAVLRGKHAQSLCADLYGQDTPCDLPADWGRELDEWLDAERHNLDR